MPGEGASGSGPPEATRIAAGHSRASPASRTVGRLRRLAVLTAASLIALAVAEGIARVYLALVPGPPDSRYVSHADAGYLLRPSARELDPTVYVNRLGFRDREHAVPKPAGTYRILGIGDSFVNSRVPLADNFLRVAAEELAPDLVGDGLRPDMVLMGLGGYSPVNEVGVLRSEGLALDPDLAVLNLYVGNDVLGIGVRGEVWRGRLFYVGSAYPTLDLLRRSRLFVLGEFVFRARVLPAIQAWRRSPVRPAAVDAAVPPAAGAEAKAPPAAGRGERPGSIDQAYVHIVRKNLPLYLRTGDPRMLRWWRKLEDCLLEFDQLCRDAGVPWVLNIIPEEIQVDPEVRAQVLADLSLSVSDYDFDAPQRRLRRFAEAHGILALDLLPEMRTRHRPEARLYEPNDTHWNVRGNRFAGQLLAGYLRHVRREETSAPGD